MNNKRKQYWGNNPRFKVPKTMDRNSNRFSCLSDLDESDDDSSIMDANQNISIEDKIPPIIVDNCHSFSSVIKLFGTKCNYKRMSIGTKLVPSTLAYYDEIIKYLKEKKMKFYTHPVLDRKAFKLALFGLPQLETAFIIEEFNTKYNIQPTKVTEVKTARSNVDDALYMLEFDRTKISKREVRKIRYVCGIVVYWRNPQKRSRGPTQCSKCAMFGHGSSNCFRDNACLGCGGPHDYSVCQLQKAPKDDAVVYKCFNCAKRNLKHVNHRADDPRCPSRKEYMEIRQKVTANRKYNKFIPSQDFSMSNDDFPSTSRQAAQFQVPSWPKNDHNSKNVPLSNSNNRTNDDLSNDKIMEIFFEAIDALEKCTNKFDKMRVLGNMLRHVI